MTSQSEKARKFRDLHEGPGLFVIPNPWDAGTAKMLQSMGYKALATTSAGASYSLGSPEGSLGRDPHLAHAAAIVAATTLPVAADLENGYGHEPAEVARTITLAAEAGLVGGSIEDYTGNPDQPIYDLDVAVARVAAAVKAARECSFPFILTARAENYLHGRPDFADTLRRLKAFEAVGADVLYAPGLRSLEEITTLCASLEKPVNVIMGLAGLRLTVAELEAAGVRRISLGSSLARAATGAFLAAAREIKEKGSFTFADEAARFSEIEDLLRSAR